ncbi:hypothetical protein C8R43DRAFT_1167048 [Mycena crocata]|nr:hypothetical protein C8R43DRAFT_1167048 [Mycena crocata]
MADNIPDEILSEILSPALKVSDDAFSDSSSDISPFIKNLESISAALLVNKAWLRVATPLLYHVVILRSKAQAQALSAAIQSNPDLGRFIKKLRVEGGYAISILHSCGNITDLFSLWRFACHSEHSEFKIQQIVLISPQTSRYAYQMHSYLREIATVHNQDVFEIPRDGMDMADLSVALGQAPNLTTLFAFCDTHRVPTYIRTIAANPSLKFIRPKPILSKGSKTADKLSPVFIHEVEANERLNALFDLSDTDEQVLPSDSSPPHISFVYPARLAANPAQEDAIWSRVLYFALRRTRQRRAWHAGPSQYLAPLQVSKKFARLGIPHLYQDTVLEQPRALHLFADRLADQPVRSPFTYHTGDSNLFRAYQLRDSH